MFIIIYFSTYLGKQTIVASIQTHLLFSSTNGHHSAFIYRQRVHALMLKSCPPPHVSNCFIYTTCSADLQHMANDQCPSAN